MQGKIDLESVAAPGIAGRDIVAPPGHRQFKAIVAIGQAEPGAQRLEPVGGIEWVFLPVSQVDDGRPEQRPVARERDAAGGAQFLAILQILDRGDVAVQPQVADFGISPFISDRRVEFVAPHGEAVLVEPIAPGQLDDVAQAQFGSPDDVGHPIRQTGAVGHHRSLVGQADRLAQRGAQAQPGALEFPVEAVSEAHQVLDPVVAGEAVEREQVRILKIDRAGILVGHGEVADRRRGDDLQPRGQHLGAAERLAHQRPFHVDRAEHDRAALPTRQAGIEAVRQVVLGRVIDVTARHRSQADFLAPRGQPGHVPLRAGKGALGVLSAGPGDRQRVGLEFDSATQHRGPEAFAPVEHRQRDRHQPLTVGHAHGLGRPASQREIAGITDPLEFQRRAQPVVAVDVVAAQECAVAGQPQ